MSIVRLENVSVTYQMGTVKVTALDTVSLDIEKGEAIAIIGPSGSGKSTMMHLVGCLDLPTQGNIFLDGKNISKLSESELANLRGKKIGFVFQAFNLMPHLTALENVELALDLQDEDKILTRKKAKELLNIVGLKNRMHHVPGQLSGGERQRVAIARALANDPELILADEPTGNLDSESGKKVIALLVDLNKKAKKTLVLVTHDKTLKGCGDRIVYLKDGRIERIAKQ